MAASYQILQWMIDSLKTMWVLTTYRQQLWELGKNFRQQENYHLTYCSIFI